MEMILGRKNRAAARQQGGMSLIELMIAMVVLAVGILGAMVLVVTAIRGNGNSRQVSNSVAMAQTVMERIMAVPASTSTIVTITDCTNTSYNVSTSVGGAPLNSSGAVDYTQAAVTNYQMLYTDCGTNGLKATYDVRWNVQAPSTYTKLVTVSAQLRSVSNNGLVFAPPVTIRTIVGQGT